MLRGKSFYEVEGNIYCDDDYTVTHSDALSGFTVHTSLLAAAGIFTQKINTWEFCVTCSLYVVMFSIIWIIKTNTHTRTHLMALCVVIPGLVGTRKVKPIWILLKQETVSGSGICWAI